MGDDHTVTTLNQFDDTDQAASCICKLLGDIAFFKFPGYRISTQSQDNINFTFSRNSTDQRPDRKAGSRVREGLDRFPPVRNIPAMPVLKYL